MIPEEVGTQAKFIFSTGRLIHDRIHELRSRYLALDERTNRCGELTLNQLEAILIIRKQGEVTMTELAGLLGVSPPSASVMVDRLVERDVLTREHSTSDRRKVMVRISAHIDPVIQGVEEALLSFFIDLIQKIGSETTQQWCEVLKKIKDALDEIPISRFLENGSSCCEDTADKGPR